MPRNFLSLLDFTPEAIGQLRERAFQLKSGAETSVLRGKLAAMIFLNPSLRTRVSFAAAMNRFGGQVIDISPGQGSWDLEFQLGVPMTGNKPEHVKEAARVLSRYVDCIGLRSFAGLQNLADDLAEPMLRAFASFATKPIINLESAMEHPCQALADVVTIAERQLQPPSAPFRRLVLLWAPHIKPLPMAVPHSALLAGAYSGLDVVVCHPPGFELADKFLSATERTCRQFGKRLAVTHEKELNEGDIVYVKSWGAARLYGDVDAQRRQFGEFGKFYLQPNELPSNSLLMHCLPVRRDVEVASAVLDSEQSVIIDQAENRLWAQAAVMEWLLSERD